MGSPCVTSTDQHDMQLQKKKLLREAAYVHGAWVEKAETFAVNDPATGETIAHLPDYSAIDAEAAVQSAYDAFPGWSKTPAKKRHDILQRWYRLIREHEVDLGLLLSLENGKPHAEVSLCWRWYI
jgi:succinate-semialdehyde dehydrogenase/glutarate-semialdehyde dehydrogenase